MASYAAFMEREFFQNQVVLEELKRRRYSHARAGLKIAAHTLAHVVVSPDQREEANGHSKWSARFYSLPVSWLLYISATFHENRVNLYLGSQRGIR